MPWFPVPRSPPGQSHVRRHGLLHHDAAAFQKYGAVPLPAVQAALSAPSTANVRLGRTSLRFRVSLSPSGRRSPPVPYRGSGRERPTPAGTCPGCSSPTAAPSNGTRFRGRGPRKVIIVPLTGSTGRACRRPCARTPAPPRLPPTGMKTRSMSMSGRERKIIAAGKARRSPYSAAGGSSQKEVAVEYGGTDMDAEGSVTVPGGSPPANPGADGSDRAEWTSWRP